MIKYCMAGAVAFLLSVSVQAEDADLEQQLTDCSLIEGSVQRLDCYDELARQLDRGEEKAEQVVTPPPTERADFGRENRNRDESDDKIYIEIVEKWQNPHGAWRFRTADGQEWHQTEVQRSFTFSDDKDYFIERGFWGAFSLGYDGSNRTTRVRRVD